MEAAVAVADSEVAAVAAAEAVAEVVPVVRPPRRSLSSRIVTRACLLLVPATTIFS